MPNRIQQIDIAHVQPSLIKGLIDNGTMRRHFVQKDDIIAGGNQLHFKLELCRSDEVHRV